MLGRRVAMFVFLTVMLTATIGAVAGLRPLFVEPSTTMVETGATPIGGMPNPITPGQRTAHQAPRTGAGPAVWVFGDSICAGLNLTPAQAWPALVAARAHVTMVNWCRPGYAFSGYLGNVSDELASAYVSGLPVPATVIVAAGTNDFPIHDSSSIIASEFAAIAVRDSLIQHGAHRVLFASVIPRGDGYEMQRQQWNLWLALQYPADFEQVDFYFNPVNAALFVRDYQPDRLHPNAAGAKLIADTFDVSKLH